MIELQDVFFSYNGEPILKKVSLRIENGAFIGIVGSNGAGKTTLVRIILGILKPTSGKRIVEERRISYVSQTTPKDDSSFPASVEEMVSLGLSFNLPWFINRRANQEAVSSILKELGIFDLRHRLVYELSGGQMQKVKIAKALVGNPSIIILDEPDTGMDEESHSKLIETINSLHQDKRMTVVFISHHLSDLEKANKIYAVDNGRVQEISRGDKNVSV